jgi:hypothetical protein
MKFPSIPGDLRTVNVYFLIGTLSIAVNMQIVWKLVHFWLSLIS